MNLATSRLFQQQKQTVKFVRQNETTRMLDEIATDIDVMILPAQDARLFAPAGTIALDGDGWIGVSVSPITALRRDDILRDATEPAVDLTVGRVFNVAGQQWYELRA